MKTSRNCQILALLLAASGCGVAARAQTAPTAATSGTLQQFLSGDLVPLDLKFSQMQSGWSRVSIERKGVPENAPANPSYDSLEPLTAGFQRYFGQGDDAVWTQGQTIDLNGQQNLVVYRAQFPAPQEASNWFKAHMSPDMKNSALSDEKLRDMLLPVARQFLDTVPLRASLINVDTIGSLQNAQTFEYNRAFAVFDKNVREQMNAISVGNVRRRSENSRANLDLLAQGLNNYIQDYDGILPPLDNWDVANKALQPYIKSEIQLAQPDQKIHTNPLLSKKKRAHLESYAQSLLVFYSDADQNGNRWVVRLGGEVEEIGANQWPQIKKASRLP